jgi:hypothetical protein
MASPKSPPPPLNCSNHRNGEIPQKSRTFYANGISILNGKSKFTSTINEESQKSQMKKVDSDKKPKANKKEADIEAAEKITNGPATPKMVQNNHRHILQERRRDSGGLTIVPLLIPNNNNNGGQVDCSPSPSSIQHSPLSIDPSSPNSDQSSSRKESSVGGPSNSGEPITSSTACHGRILPHQTSQGLLFVPEQRRISTVSGHSVHSCPSEIYKEAASNRDGQGGSGEGSPVIGQTDCEEADEEADEFQVLIHSPSNSTGPSRNASPRAQAACEAYSRVYGSGAMLYGQQHFLHNEQSGHGPRLSVGNRPRPERSPPHSANGTGKF